MGMFTRSSIFAIGLFVCAATASANTVYVPFIDTPPVRMTQSYVSVAGPGVVVSYDAVSHTFSGHGRYVNTVTGQTNAVNESITQDGVTGSNQAGTFSFSFHVDAIGAIDDRSSFLMTNLDGSTVYYKGLELNSFGYQKLAGTGRYDFYIKFVQVGPSAINGMFPGRNFAANLLGGTLTTDVAASQLFASSFDTSIGYKADVFGTPLPSAAVGGAGLLCVLGALPYLRRRRVVG